MVVLYFPNLRITAFSFASTVYTEERISNPKIKNPIYFVKFFKGELFISNSTFPNLIFSDIYKICLIITDCNLCKIFNN